MKTVIQGGNMCYVSRKLDKSYTAEMFGFSVRTEFYLHALISSMLCNITDLMQISFCVLERLPEIWVPEIVVIFILLADWDSFTAVKAPFLIPWVLIQMVLLD